MSIFLLTPWSAWVPLSDQAAVPKQALMMDRPLPAIEITAQKILSLPENQIDLAETVLDLSRIVYRELYGKDFDPAIYKDRINQMSVSIRKARSKAPGMISTVQLINRELFDHRGFEFDHANPNGNKDQSVFLNTILDRKKGYCLGLSILYLSIAERLQLPAEGIVLPEHIFVRYGSGDKSLNIELTNRGMFRTDASYRQEFGVPAYHTVYMKPVTKKELIGIYVENLGLAYKRKGKLERAQSLYETALMLNSRHIATRINLANLFAGQQKWDEAADQFRKALQLDPENAMLHYRLGVALGKSGDHRAEIYHFEKSVQMDPSYAEAYIALGDIYGRNGLLDASITASKKALAIKPDSSLAHLQIGLAYFFKKDYRKSSIYIQKADKLGAKIPPLLVRTFNLRR